MDEGERLLLRSLVAERRLLALGVVVPASGGDAGAPYVGQVPFALTPSGDLLIHVSRLAKHSRGLAAGAPWSGLLQVGDDGHADPFRLPRLTLEGHVEILERGTDRHAAASDVFLAKLPTGAMMFQLGDFTLYQLAVERGRLVAGFGHTLNVTAQHLREAASPGAGGAADSA